MKNVKIKIYDRTNRYGESKDFSIWNSFKCHTRCIFYMLEVIFIIIYIAYLCKFILYLIIFRTHGDAPQVTIHGRTDLTFPYVPSHISYILLELLKNSMRASVEYHGIDNMPPIRIVIADGEKNEDVIIKVKYYHFWIF